MAKKEKQIGITVNKEDDMPEWYTQVVLKSELADYAPIKGCMVLRPLGNQIWTKIQTELDTMIFKQGVSNAYFPMFIPEEFFKREAQHAEGFKAEVAWIEPKSEDAARYAIRPTSETIMYDSYSRWIRSWRDLPLRINQWCNICRWEVQDCKLFLRSREFLWQEGHCVYETDEECHAETMMYLEDYRSIAEDLLAVPVILGQKTEKEKFAGALRTYTIEGFMPDGKALQLGTSHDLGQGFAKAFEVKYIGKDEKEHYGWQNSWGISWRMIGGMVMTHSDNKGLILPPRAATHKIVIIPIIFEDSKEKVLKEANKLKEKLGLYNPLLDDRDGYSAGWKFNEWELKGIPLRLELGPKDLEKQQAVVVRRDTNEKTPVKLKDLQKEIPKILEKMQSDLFAKAKKQLESRITTAKDWNDFKKKIKDKKLVKAHFCGQIQCEELIKDETQGATTRCIPLEGGKKKGKCIKCGKDSDIIVYFAKAY